MLACKSLLTIALAAPAAQPATPPPAGSGPPSGVSAPLPSRTWELGRLGAVSFRTELRWGWAGLYGAGYSPSGEPRWIQRFEASLVRGPLSGTRLEWITIGPSPNPRERWMLGQGRNRFNENGLPAAMTRLSVPLPRTRLELSVQRPVGVLSPRGVGRPARGAFISGKF